MGGLRGAEVVNAAIDALRADSTLTTLLGGTSTVYAHVPEDTAPPYVLVLAGREIPIAQAFADDDSRSVEVMAMVVSAYRGTKQMDDICHQVATRLTTDATWSGITGFMGQAFAEAERPNAEEVNGQVWYSRRLSVAVWVQ